MDRFFFIIGRISSLLLLLVLVGAAILMATLAWSNFGGRRHDAVAVQAPDAGAKKLPAFLELHNLENIVGTDVDMMELSTDSGSAKFSGSGYNQQVRNILFLSGEKKSPHWLFAKHANLVLIKAQLADSDERDQAKTTQALYVEFVSHDSNNDGVLSRDDDKTVALTKANGTGLVKVLQGVTRVLEYKVIDQGKLVSLVYQSQGKLHHARFSLGTLTKLSDLEIISLEDK